MSHFSYESTDELAGTFGLITGGSMGIGLACSKELLVRGIEKLAILDINISHDACRRLVNQFGKNRVVFIKCDVSNKDDIESAFRIVKEQFGDIDYVINNAGVMNDAEWEREIAINLNGVIFGTLLGIKYMSKAEGAAGGTIINLSSLSGIEPFAGCPIYSATSSAIISITKSFSLPYHYLKSNIRMMVVCPGITFTKMISGVSDKMLDREIGSEYLKEISRTSTQKPEAVSGCIVDIILHGENGNVWVSDGGQSPYQVQLPNLNELRNK